MISMLGCTAGFPTLNAKAANAFTLLCIPAWVLGKFPAMATVRDLAAFAGPQTVEFKLWVSVGKDLSTPSKSAASALLLSEDTITEEDVLKDGIFCHNFVFLPHVRAWAHVAGNLKVPLAMPHRSGLSLKNNLNIHAML